MRVPTAMIREYSIVFGARALPVAGVLLLACSGAVGPGSATSSTGGTGGAMSSGPGSSGSGSSAVDDSGTARPDPDAYEPACSDRPATQAIGNWDVVPHQTFAEPVEIGVVAFHEAGVDVVFSVGDRELDRVRNPSWNPRTSVYEYWTTFDPSEHADGPIRVSAVIEPDCPGHSPRALDDLPLFANAGGSLTNDRVVWVDCASGSDDQGRGSEPAPYATIEKGLVEAGDGGTVYLQPGTCYELTSIYPEVELEQWTTVRPAPGVDRSQIRILTKSDVSTTSTEQFRQDMVRWKNVGLYSQSPASYSAVLYVAGERSTWLDGSEVYEERGRWNQTVPFAGDDGHRVYLTDSHIHDVMNAGFRFGRGVKVTEIASDVFRAKSNTLSVNLTVRGIDRGDTDAHPDFFQHYAPDGAPENIVIYNTVVTDMEAQGIFGGPGALSDVAFVNLVLEKDPADSPLTSQMSGSWNHVLLWHVTTVDSGFLLRELEDVGNVYMVDGSWHSLHHGGDTSVPGVIVDYNHFATLAWSQEAGPMGTHATHGQPGYADVANDDYRPAAGSPLCEAGIPLPGVPADVNGDLYHPERPALGAYACP